VKKVFSKDSSCVSDPDLLNLICWSEPDPDPGFTESSSNHDPVPDQFFFNLIEFTVEKNKTQKCHIFLP